MNTISLPKKFNDFTDARQQGFIAIKQLKEQGKNIVGVFCAFTPVEIMDAAGAISVSLCGTSEESIPEAEKYLPRNLCPLIKSSYGFAVTDSCPYFYFSDLIVGETTCDGKKKMYELLNELKPVHVMQLPQTNKGENVFNLWRNEIVSLKEKLENKFNVIITDDKLREVIKLRNKYRKALKRFYELSCLCPPPMTGYEMLQVLHGTGFKTDKKSQIEIINELTDDILEEYNDGLREISLDSPRILITGCPVGGATEKIIKTIEDNGGVVVCFETCGGAKSNDELVDENIDPIDALAQKYLNIPCSCISPNEKRFKLLNKLIDQYKVDGIIEVILQSCHTYNVESFKVKKFVNNKKDLPYMSIETDYSQSDASQLKTRISAFIEML
ncbi:2-hydroxyglutaryl-CoA dehydratase beta subunit HgdB [Gottschalkia purinilytica]|uniref:2-hydroxyglutaryl-CoA dehydratase beta subunit HgdB n=1 Tax=Gottschalkia purinilytica TaxID=1503 RepID=A0A0L0WAA9_GOTPU|nr:2-hydroxyglutaryl-CoA dehydratase beta subunit HgdB [Gottschalkia purinilytica]